MALQDDILAINTRLSIFDTEFQAYDRGQFYIEHYLLTGSSLLGGAGSLFEGSVSMFSGLAG